MGLRLKNELVTGIFHPFGGCQYFGDKYAAHTCDYYVVSFVGADTFKSIGKAKLNPILNVIVTDGFFCVFQWTLSQICRNGRRYFPRQYERSRQICVIGPYVSNTGTDANHIRRRLKSRLESDHLLAR